MTAAITALEARLVDAKTPGEKVTALNALAWPMRTVSPRRALALCEEAVQLARTSSLLPDLAQSLCLAGVCATVLGQYEAAQAALDECLPLCRQAGDLSTEAHCLHSLGALHYAGAEYQDAMEKVTAALQIREDLEDWEGVGASYNMLGNIQFALCDYALALDWYTRSLKVRERIGDTHGVIVSLDNIGNIYGERGEFAEAAKYHQRGLDHAVRLGSPMLEISLLCNLGGDYSDLGRYDESLEASRRTIELAEPLENWSRVSFALTNMAHAYGKTHRQADALDCYARALEITQATGDQKVAAHSLFSIGEMLLGLGDLEQARARLAQAFALAQRIGARRTAFQAAECLAEACKRLGDYPAALGHYEAFHRLEKEVFTEEAEDRAKSLIVKMEVEHHRRESETLSEINAALQAANAALEALATTDPLTHLLNHRALVAALDAEMVRVRRGDSCALLFLDIDHFKSVNDTYGHPVGDAVLREFAACVRACLREEDTLGRWGGEEFLVLLPGTDLEGAVQAGERIRAAVAAHPLAAQEGLYMTSGLHMTCSLGAAACPPQDAVRDTLVQAADRALYAAKRLGRNQVRGADDPALSALDGPLFSAGMDHASAPRRIDDTPPAVSA